MISYFQFRDTHYCDTARIAGDPSPHGEKTKPPPSTPSPSPDSEGSNNSGGTNHVNNTQNNNQSDGVVNSSGGGRPTPRTDWGGFGTTPTEAGLQAQENFRKITQQFGSFLDTAIGKITTGISETLGTQRTTSQDTEKGINEMGQGDGENEQTTGNCVMVGHTQNCFYDAQNDSEPSDNTEYGDKPDWQDNTFNVEDAENQDIPYGTWNDMEVNTEGVPTTVTGGEPSDTGKVEVGTWFKTIGFVPLLAIGAGLIYFARRKK